MKTLFIVIMTFSVLVLKGFAQGNKIDELLNRSVTTSIVNGETYLQRDLTDYLNMTLGKFNVKDGIVESDDLISVSLLKSYFMKPHPSVSTLEKYFNQASKEFAVPGFLLMIIGQIENNWTQTGPTIDNGWGIMHLVQNNYCNTLGEAAKLIGVSEQTLKDDAFQNIRGAAALIANYAGDKRVNFSSLSDWLPALAKFSGLISNDLREMQALNYLATLKSGVSSRTVWGEKINIKPQLIGNVDTKLQEYQLRKTASSDYGPAITNLTPYNYAAGRTHSIDTWVNHWIGSGTYLGAISRFMDPSQQVSAHFVIKNNNGGNHSGCSYRKYCMALWSFGTTL